ncbi:kelch repeat-containing protein, partial [Toxoplasma gondii CAST]
REFRRRRVPHCLRLGAAIRRVCGAAKESRKLSFSEDTAVTDTPEKLSMMCGFWISLISRGRKCGTLETRRRPGTPELRRDLFLAAATSSNSKSSASAFRDIPVEAQQL